jgi:hypothetical protein
MHYSPNCVLSPFHQQVDVIWHQTISVKVERQLGLLLGKASEYLLIVIGVAEDLPAIVPPRDDVIQTTLYFEPGFSRHLVWPFRDSKRIAILQARHPGLPN